MRILAVAQVEETGNIYQQLNKQTIQPDAFIFHDQEPEAGINSRRKRIAHNHSKLIAAVKDHQPDYVWQLEQDVELPSDALERLIDDHQRLSEEHPNLGYVSGIQVGRHGIYCLGAWHVGEDVFSSLNYELEGLQQVDATGFYCLLAKTDVWLKGKASWNGEPWGPDVNWGLSLKRLGYITYVDMNLHVGHITDDRGIIRPKTMSNVNVTFKKQPNGEWKYRTT